LNVLTVALVGAGNIAGGYDQNRRQDEKGIYSHAGAYVRNGKFMLQTVFDTDLERAKAFQSYWKVQNIAVGINDIYERFHDVVSVCSPDNTHFDIVKNLIGNQCCRVVFVEKPVALTLNQIGELKQLSDSGNIDVVVNFQRKNNSGHQSILNQVALAPETLLSVGAYYIKGLHHIGITMLDTLTFFLGYPVSVLTYNRVFNQEVDDYSYEFILFYEGFNVVVRTTDAERYQYNYHIFEIDLLFSDRRLTIFDNSRTIRECRLSDYAYSGVKVLSDTTPVYNDSGMSTAMVDAVDYIYNIATEKISHTTNTLNDSFNCMRVLERVVESFERGSITLQMEKT